MRSSKDDFSATCSRNVGAEVVVPLDLPPMICFRVTRSCNARCGFCLVPPDGAHPNVDTLTLRIDWLLSRGVKTIHFLRRRTDDRPFHVVEADGRVVLEGATETMDEVLGYIPAGVVAKRKEVADKESIRLVARAKADGAWLARCGDVVHAFKNRAVPAAASQRQCGPVPRG